MSFAPDDPDISELHSIAQDDPDALFARLDDVMDVFTNPEKKPDAEYSDERPFLVTATRNALENADTPESGIKTHLDSVNDTLEKLGESETRYQTDGNIITLCFELLGVVLETDPDRVIEIADAHNHYTTTLIESETDLRRRFEFYARLIDDHPELLEDKVSDVVEYTTLRGEFTPSVITVAHRLAQQYPYKFSDVAAENEAFADAEFYRETVSGETLEQWDEIIGLVRSLKPSFGDNVNPDEINDD